MRSTLVYVSLLALCSVPGLAATPKPAGPSPARHLPAPDNVSSQTRQLLKTRMRQHATSTQNLLRAVVLLDRPTIKVLADQIAGEQIFAPGAISRSALPAHATGKSDAFAAAARELAFAAATVRDDDVLADRFAVLTHACVSCHGVYLHGRLRRIYWDSEPIDREPQPREEQPNEDSSHSPQAAPR